MAVGVVTEPPFSTTCAPYYPQCSQPVRTIVPIKTAAPIIYTPKPTVRAVVTIAPTLRPTKSPTPKPTPTLVPTVTPSPQVQGASAESTPEPTPTPTPTIKPLTAGETAISLGVFALMIGLPIWVIAKIVRRFRKPKLEV